MGCNRGNLKDTKRKGRSIRQINRLNERRIVGEREIDREREVCVCVSVSVRKRERKAHQIEVLFFWMYMN